MACSRFYSKPAPQQFEQSSPERGLRTTILQREDAKVRLARRCTHLMDAYSRLIGMHAPRFAQPRSPGLSVSIVKKPEHAVTQFQLPVCYPNGCRKDLDIQ